MSEKLCPVSHGQPLPVAEPETGLTVMKELARRRSFLAALEVMQAEVGDAFQITLPSFEPAVFSGPTFNRCVLVSQRDEFLWRPEKDPVTRLLRHGLLVEDGEEHDALRALMEPATTRLAVNEHVDDMVRYTDRVLDQWQDGSTVDMLIEMRRVALLILMGTLFGTEFAPEMDRLWKPILRSLKYISPGLWVIWPNIPRPGYGRPLRQLDEYLYSIIRHRRERGSGSRQGDLLDRLIDGGLSDDLVRDQMLTMLIAGHDTSTALLSWTLYLLGSHPEIMDRVQDEVDGILGERAPTVEGVTQLRYLDQVVKESLRLYPPIHVGNRMTPKEIQVESYTVPADTRVMYSIYLTHRDKKHWPDPLRFNPDRFDRSLRQGRPALAYVPFGGGPRNCIGATFAQVESKIVLARVLQRFKLRLLDQRIRPHMGATLEPRPGVKMRLNKRGNGRA